MNYDCNYCAEPSAKRESLMSRITTLNVSHVYLFRDQTYPGRVVVASKDHYTEIFEMPDDVRDKFFLDVSLVAKALKEIFKADKINYSIWGDKVSHTHIHLVPKRADLPNWGAPFLNDSSNPTLVEEDVFQERLNSIRQALEN